MLFHFERQLKSTIELPSPMPSISETTSAQADIMSNDGSLASFNEILPSISSVLHQPDPELSFYASLVRQHPGVFMAELHRLAREQIARERALQQFSSALYQQYSIQLVELRLSSGLGRLPAQLISIPRQVRPRTAILPQTAPPIHQSAPVPPTASQMERSTSTTTEDSAYSDATTKPNHDPSGPDRQTAPPHLSVRDEPWVPVPGLPQPSKRRRDDDISGESSQKSGKRAKNKQREPLDPCPFPLPRCDACNSPREYMSHIRSVRRI
jgi:hypothetical protein